MNDNLKLIQKQVDALKSDILNVWNKEGKWDLENPEAPYNGMENDPIVNLLLTAVVYQSNLISDELGSFNDSLIDEIFDLLLPYDLVRPVPAIAMMETSLNKGKQSFLLDDSSHFVIKKKNSKSKASFSFYPVINTKIINARIVDINRISNNKWNVHLFLENSDDSLAGMTFCFDNIDFYDLKVSWNDEVIPVIKPKEIDRLPLNPMFSANNHIYNSSMVYSIETQWFDLFAENDMNLYMIPLYYDKPIENNDVNLVFEFDDCPFEMELDTDNFRINCFPIVNVILNNNNNSKPFILSESRPIVCISSENWQTNTDNSNEAPNYFMNLILLDDDDYRNKDRFILRRFGAERFNLNELLILGKKLTQKYQSDFYAFQSVEQLQNSSVLQKLDEVLKEIIDILNKQDTPRFGIYAILKHIRSNALPDNVININALFTNGCNANCNEKDVSINAQSHLASILDIKHTRLITNITGGKDPVIDTDAKQQLAKYYVQTNDRIITRNDMRSFIIKQLAVYGINRNMVKDIKLFGKISEAALIQNVEVLLDESVKADELPKMARIIEKLANLRCANGYIIKVRILN